MNVTYCDTCNNVLKGGAKKWVFAFKEVKESEDNASIISLADLQEKIRKQNQANEKIKSCEICEGCKKVLDSFLALRRHQVLKIKNEIDKLEI